jgi:hypothetical protein
VESIGWPDDLSADKTTWTIEGPIRFSIVLSPKVVKTGTCESIHVTRDGRTITSIWIHFRAETVKEAGARAKRLLEECGYSSEELDKWVSGTVQSERDSKVVPGDFSRGFSGKQIDCDLAIRHSFDKARPWYVHFAINVPTAAKD